MQKGNIDMTHLSNGTVATDNARVLNKKTLRSPVPGSVYIGRPSIWGNPFVIGKDGTRAEVIAKYELWIKQQPDLMAKISHLKGKSLICWCSPLECHGNVLVRLANSSKRTCE
jgi:hypothetical protein